MLIYIHRFDNKFTPQLTAQVFDLALFVFRRQFKLEAPIYLLLVLFFNINYAFPLLRFFVNIKDPGVVCLITNLFFPADIGVDYLLVVEIHSNKRVKFLLNFQQRSNLYFRLNIYHRFLLKGEYLGNRKYH